MVSYALATLGSVGLYACLVFSLASIACLCVGQVSKNAGATRMGYLGVFAAAVSILVSCAVIVHGFFAHNVAIQYVAQNYPADTGSLYWLFKLSGLWASRAGSLLLWGFLIAAFAAWVAWHRRRAADGLSSVALVVTQVVLVMFLLVMLLSEENNPFVMTNPSLIGDDGQLIGSASTWGMNVLLEHWAMALHPPTLFVGYAGMTIPFAYGIAALVVNDPSRRWVDLCQRIALFSFIFLTIGIGLGAVWAYVVLGWGGYWGWDPVENASLLSWLTAVAMLHSFNVYRRRTMMRGWALLAATLTFCFVVMGTFITRSGLVESVHAFAEDPVSTYMFIAIMVGTMLALLIGWFARRKTFMSGDDIESVISKNGSFYLTNLVMVFSAVLVAYLTISSALPSWLPAGGVTIGTGAYESVARPLGILVCLLAAVCPFLSWRKTDGAEFVKNVRVSVAVAIVLFAVLMVEFSTRLLPAYNDIIAMGGTPASELQGMGPAWYYNGLAVLALLVAALLAANSAYLLARGVRARIANKGEGAGLAVVRLFTKSPAQAGGYLTHLGLGVVLVGLVASSMYVTEHTYAFAEDQNASIELGGYTLQYQGVESVIDESENYVYTASLHVSKGERDLGELHPVVTRTASSGYQQAKYAAEVRSSFFEDLFVVFQGYASDGSVVINARVNPLIWLVWLGFGVMVAGIVASTLPKRGLALQAAGAAHPVAGGTGGAKASSKAGKAGKGGTSSGKAAGASRPKKSARPRKSR